MQFVKIIFPILCPKSESVQLYIKYGAMSLLFFKIYYFRWNYLSLTDCSAIFGSLNNHQHFGKNMFNFVIGYEKCP